MLKILLGKDFAINFCGKFFDCFRTALNSNSAAITLTILFWQFTMFHYRVDLHK